MIHFNIDEEHAILTVCPEGALSEQDFARVAAAVDPIIELQGELTGLIIHTKAFPGWDSFASMLSHFRFVRDHHRHIKKLAVVSDSAVLNIFPHISAHFISAELKHFHFNEYSDALTWLQANGQNR
ncbi:MAG: STAS/SEC14 domain-containing protein [Mariprofundus sp.]|nr:STAS/SEC14 domain-containing protein [Mariprofundus sp.]